MKICSKCKELKSFESFNKRSNRIGGLRCECRSCQSEYRRVNFLKNKEKQLTQSLQWKRENWNHCLEYAKEYGKAHLAKASERQMKRHSIKVSTSILNGDEWNDFVLQELYDLRKIRDEETGFKWHVDHIVPLRGKTVSGFHVWYNLKLIPATINLRKSNTFSQ